MHTCYKIYDYFKFQLFTYHLFSVTLDATLRQQKLKLTIALLSSSIKSEILKTRKFNLGNYRYNLANTCFVKKRVNM